MRKTGFFCFTALSMLLGGFAAAQETAPPLAGMPELTGQPSSNGTYYDPETGETTTIIDPGFPPAPPVSGSEVVKADPSELPGGSDYIPARPLAPGIPSKPMKAVQPVKPDVPQTQTPGIAVPTVQSPVAPVVEAPIISAPDAPKDPVVKPVEQVTGSAKATEKTEQPVQAPLSKGPRIYDAVTGKDITAVRRAESVENTNSEDEETAVVPLQAVKGNPDEKQEKPLPPLRASTVTRAPAPAMQDRPPGYTPIFDALSGREINAPAGAKPYKAPVFDAVSGKQLNADPKVKPYQSPVIDAITGNQLNGAQNEKNGYPAYVPFKRDAITNQKVDTLVGNNPNPPSEEKPSLRDRIRQKMKKD